LAPEKTVSLPDSFTLYETTASAPERWWETFQSDEAGRLVEEALAGNLTLHQTYARLVQSQMLARQTRAPLFPTLDASADASITRKRTDTGQSSSPTNPGGTGGTTTPSQQSNSSVSTSTVESYRLGLSSSYEVDLWGRVRAQREGALLDLEATREDLHAAMLSLSAAVIRQWLTIVARTQELELVHEQLNLNRITLELMDLRYRKGLATALDVYQQRQIVARTEALLPTLESQVQSARHDLAVLLGRQPRAHIEVSADTLPNVGAIPDPGLPAGLLARRPDVRAAGLRLRAAEWRVGAAQADRLPALRLSGSASYGAAEWDLIFDNWMATLAGSLTGPIFDAGRRKAETIKTRAVVDERLAAYRERVLQAIKEVENAMLYETKYVDYIDALERELEAARVSHEQALVRYRKGLNDYLPVLSALSSLQVLERQLVQAQLARLNYRVQLCIALGGGWMSENVIAPESSYPLQTRGEK